jgi:CRP-like cAMP-binding protein
MADRHQVNNQILLALPPKEADPVFAALEFVQLRTHDVLYEAGEPISHGYFMDSGLASFLSAMASGKSVEVGLAGREGFVGLPLIVGLKTSPTRVVIQVAGAAFRLRTSDLAALLPRCRNWKPNYNASRKS